jgi:hypothetical protein
MTLSIYWSWPEERRGNRRRKSYDEELCDMYSPADIVWAIRSRIMKWAGNMVYMG